MEQPTCSKKQLGDACEMLVAAELTFAGVPAMMMPDCWPHYDLVAQPADGGPAQRISVKGRRFKPRGEGDAVAYDVTHDFDWLAIVLLPGEGQERRRYFVIPKSAADARSDKSPSPTSKTEHNRWTYLDQVPSRFAEFEDNFCLSIDGVNRAAVRR